MSDDREVAGIGMRRAPDGRGDYVIELFRPTGPGGQGTDPVCLLAVNGAAIDTDGGTSGKLARELLQACARAVGRTAEKCGATNVETSGVTTFTRGEQPS